MKLKHKLAICRAVMDITIRIADFWLLLSEKAMDRHEALVEEARYQRDMAKAYHWDA